MSFLESVYVALLLIIIVFAVLFFLYAFTRLFSYIMVKLSNLKVKNTNDTKKL